MSEMVERVARALARKRAEDSGRAVHADCVQRGTPYVPPPEEQMANFVDHAWPSHVAQARTAIEAMRESTEAMTGAGDALHIHDISNADDQWRAMIDEALR